MLRMLLPSEYCPSQLVRFQTKNALKIGTIKKLPNINPTENKKFPYLMGCVIMTKYMFIKASYGILIKKNKCE